MEREAFGRKISSGQRPRLDRFVAPRDSFPELSWRFFRSAHPDLHNKDAWLEKCLQQKNYVSYLDKAFGLDQMKCQDTDSKEDGCVQLWPCVPRIKKCLSAADSILDLPTYSYATFPELVDWSRQNILVAALGRKYYKWNWDTQSLLSQGQAYYDIQCCKYDPKGDLLALATKIRGLEIHDNATSKRLTNRLCVCERFDEPLCTITAVNWSPTGKSLVIGCCQGTLGSFTQDARLIGWHKQAMRRKPVLSVRVSPDARYAVAAFIKDSTILILTWPLLKLLYNIAVHGTVKTIAWHPWRSALLGVGSETSEFDTIIDMWDAPTGKQRGSSITRSNHILDMMLFNHNSGELVLSMRNIDRELTNEKNYSELVVMSDANTVVDQWGGSRTELDHVRTMVFSPDGTKLATATAEEDLIIWKFLPEDKRKKKKHKRFSALPVYLDRATPGGSSNR